MLLKLLVRLRPALVCAPLLVASVLMGQTINVGAGQTYTTIQAGINAAANGDTVLVAQGTYYENVDFKGKAITVTSSGGAATTIIDGGNTAPAVVFITGEMRTSVLSGFTIQHGGLFNYSTSVNGGIYLSNSQPTIRNNVLTQNNCWTIYSELAGPLIQGNDISATQDPQGHCSFGGGAGVYIGGDLPSNPYTNSARVPALIIGNTIHDNVESGLETAGGNGGAAIAIWGGSPIILNNILRNNASPGGTGGAMNVSGAAGVAIIQNLIYGNSAGCGGGALAVDANPEPKTGIAALVANNTIVDNVGPGKAAYTNCTPISQFYPAPGAYGESNPSTMFINNIISGSTSYPAVNCSSPQNPSESFQPTFKNNILYNGVGPFFGSGCVDVSGKYNNIVMQPQFVNSAAGDYHLVSGSTGVDAGDSTLQQTFLALTGMNLYTDFGGNARVQDATGKGCIIDTGAYEVTGTESMCSSMLLTSSLNPSTFGQSVTFTAQLATQNGNMPTGSVQFSDGSTVLQSITVSGTGVAAYPTSSLSIGTHMMKAMYQPSGGFAGETATLTQVVYGFSTTTALTCSSTPIPFAGTALLPVMVSSANGTPTGSISFTDNGSALVTEPLTSGTTSLTYTGLAAGSHTITATYLPTGNFNGSSSSCTETVIGLPSVSVLSVNPLSSAYDAPVTLTTTVAAATPPGLGAPTGTVTFYNGSTSIGSGALANGVASLTLSTLPPGTNSITCSYGGSSFYAASTCNTVSQTVISGFTLALAPNPITLQQGSTGTVAIQLASKGLYAGTLRLSYGTLPTNASASLSSSTVTLAAGGTASSNFLLNTYTPPAATSSIGARRGNALLAVFACMLIPLGLTRRRRLKHVLCVVLSMVALQALTGCTTIVELLPQVAPGTYQIPITATDNNGASQSASLTLVVTARP